MGSTCIVAMYPQLPGIEGMFRTLNERLFFCTFAARKGSNIFLDSYTRNLPAIFGDGKIQHNTYLEACVTFARLLDSLVVQKKSHLDKSVPITARNYVLEMSARTNQSGNILPGYTILSFPYYLTTKYLGTRWGVTKINGDVPKTSIDIGKSDLPEPLKQQLLAVPT